MSATADVAILVVNYHSHGLVSQLLDSIDRHTGGARVVVAIADNSNHDAEHAALTSVATKQRRSLASVMTSRTEGNVGFAAGNWHAWKCVEHHSPRIVITANPDTVIRKGSLHDIAQAVAAEGPALWGARTFQAGHIHSGISRLAPHTGASHPVDAPSSDTQSGLTYPGGHFLAMSSSVWKKYSGYSAAYFLYCEELDLKLRMLASVTTQANVKVNLLPSFEVEHVGAATTQAGVVISTLSQVHANRSRVVLYRSHRVLRRYLPSLLFCRLTLALALAFRGRTGDARATLTGLASGLTARLDQTRGR
ncbi:glycosyltransferase family 2 protein [Cellulomonas sp. zg-ZUI40]|nr:glycosyltransferase family 2 protein [Cellulomonas dongxiuzhuiae]